MQEELTFKMFAFCQEVNFNAWNLRNRCKIAKIKMKIVFKRGICPPTVASSACGLWRLALPSAAADNGISWDLCGRQFRGEVKYVAAQSRTRQHILIRHAGYVIDIICNVARQCFFLKDT